MTEDEALAVPEVVARCLTWSGWRRWAARGTDHGPVGRDPFRNLFFMTASPQPESAAASSGAVRALPDKQG